MQRRHQHYEPSYQWMLQGVVMYRSMKSSNQLETERYLRHPNQH